MTLDLTPTQPSDSEVQTQSTDDLRRTLEDWQREREALLTELSPTAAPHIDPVAYAQYENARATIAEIRAALERVADGTYGVCTVCAKEIPPARLEIRPYTSRCVNCQSDGR